MDWKDNLLTDDARIHALLKGARRIAVLGIKSDAEDTKPAHAVPRYLQKHGYEIVHPLTTEPWGVRRFFVRAPDGNVINVVHHRD